MFPADTPAAPPHPTQFALAPKSEAPALLVQACARAARVAGLTEH